MLTICFLSFLLVLMGVTEILDNQRILALVEKED